MHNKFILFTFAFVFLSCTKEIDDNKTEIRFEESSVLSKKVSATKTNSITLQVPDSVVFGAPNYTLDINPVTGQLYILDAISRFYLVFDEDGNYVSRFGGEGRGPEEFLLPFATCFDPDGNFYVYDDMQRLIKKFDSEFELTDTIVTDPGAYYITGGLMFCTENSIYAPVIESRYTAAGDDGLSSAWKSSYLMKYDLSKSSTSFWGNYDLHQKNNLSNKHRPVFYIDFSGQQIYATHRNSFKIRILRLENAGVKAHFGRKTENYKEQITDPSTVRPFSNESRMILYEQSMVSKIFPDSDKKYLMLYYMNGNEQWDQNRDLSDLDYFLKIYSLEDYSLIGELQLPHRVSAVNGNKLLLIMNEDPAEYTLAWYEITIH